LPTQGDAHAPNHADRRRVALSLLLIGLTDRPASAQLMAKAQVANLIVKVENGVDDFTKYLEKRRLAKATPALLLAPR
jgi:hypothetical protein